jgi:hypothetical protein
LEEAATAVVVVDVEVRPCEEGIFFMVVAEALVGVGDLKGRSVPGVGGGEIKATFL